MPKGAERKVGNRLLGDGATWGLWRWFQGGQWMGPRGKRALGFVWKGQHPG